MTYKMGVTYYECGPVCGLNQVCNNRTTTVSILAVLQQQNNYRKYSCCTAGIPRVLELNRVYTRYRQD